MEYHGIEKLRGAENWNIWKFAVRNLLRGIEGAYEVCIGEIVKPDPLGTKSTAEQIAEYQGKLKVWDKADRAASQLVVKCLEAKVMSLLVACDSARDMWIKLHAVFEQQTKQATHTVQAEFFNFSMNPIDDMVTHIAKYEGLVLRMHQLNVKPDESSLMVKLLDTLPDEYESLRQAWWARSEDQQTFINLVGVLTSDENRRHQRAQKQEELVALTATNSKAIWKHKRGGTTGCKNQKSKYLNESAAGKKNKPLNFKCYRCGEKGHVRRYCPSAKFSKHDVSSMSTGNDNNEAFVTEVMTAELDDDVWIVDSGATDHVTHNGDWFSSFKPFHTPVKVHIGDKSTMDALGKGMIKFETVVNGKWLSYHMEDVLYVPAAHKNLLSMTSALDKGMTCHSSNKKCEFVKDGVVKAQGVRVGQLFKMVIRVIPPEVSCISNEVNLMTKDTLQIWHERLGHQNKRHVKKILKQHKIDFVEDNQFCGACVEGKQHRDTFKLRTQRAKEPGEIIHADLCGPMECTSLGGAKYFVCFTCDYSRFRKVYFLKEKSETTEKILEMLQIVKTQVGRSLRMFQCDGGTEFNNREVGKLLKSNGVNFTIVNPYTPEQNGCAERTNRTIVESARSMLLSKNLPKYLWAEAVNVAVYTLNRAGPSSVDGQSPYELFTGKNVHMEKLHVFGTECFVHVPKERRKKWDAKGQHGVFVGYSENVDGFRVWLKSKNHVIRSRDVVFKLESAGKSLEVLPSLSDDDTMSDNQQQSLTTSLTNIEPEQVEMSKEAGRQLRDRTKIKARERLIEVMLSEVDEPKSFMEAITSENQLDWKAAMEDEMASLAENSTWTLMELPLGRKSISNRWVYRLKRSADGEISRYKARLVARGFSQREGIDYTETFSPVARFDTIRAVLAVAANEHLELAQFDVKTAFLYGVIEEDIYMQQPEGFTDGTDHVCKHVS